MKRYVIAGADICEEHPDGKWVLHSDAQATIARLTAELAEARASAEAAYERAATLQVFGYDMFGPATKTAIRALATEAETDALAEIVDAETRACAEVADQCWEAGYRHTTKATILARIDQRRGAGA